jgi:serine/threonine-protein kinase
LSPDGRRIAFAVTAGLQNAVAVRAFDALEAQVLAGTGSQPGFPSHPFWSGDGRFIGFFAAGKLKKIDATGGSPLVICDAPNREGGTWNRDGTIVFAPISTGGLFQVLGLSGMHVPKISRKVRTSDCQFQRRFPRASGQTVSFCAAFRGRLA